MLQTFEAVTDEQGNIRLIDSVKLPAGWRVLITVLHESTVNVPETALLTEAALATDWNTREEDEAWSHLQSEQSS